LSEALPSREAIVATAGEAIARGSRSFAAASRLFDRPTRERAWLLYAWCRRCDDLADGQDHGHGMTAVEDPQTRLMAIRLRTQAALDGRWVGDPAFDALRIVASETEMPHSLVWDVVEGFALDAAGWRPQSEADLLRYCYHVAGAVGCMMALVMGVSLQDEAVLDRACDLGLAFQLANIARDLAEDEAAGRCYLPGDWLSETSDRVTLAARLAERARAYEASARGGTPALGFRAAWAVLAAAGIYGDIARKVAALGPHAWDARVGTSAAEKIGWIARSWGEARRRKQLYGAVPRPAGLWTRPG
jgi:15-cis-phytoene synthase